MPEKKPSGLTRRTQEQVAPLQLTMKQVTRTESIFNENQVQKIFNSTPAKYKYQRPAKGGGTWTYLKSSYVRRVLDGLFGFNWQFDIETTVAEAFEVASMTGVVVVKGILTGTVKVDGQWISIRKTQFGRSEVKWLTDMSNGKKTRRIDEWTGKPMPLDFGNDVKAATSDALKKCASLLGIGADVYDPEEFMAIEIIGSEENSAKAKQIKKQVANAKRAVRAASTKVGGQNDSNK